MSRTRENTGFRCEQCGRSVAPLTNGSYRNHCPFCLYSKHVDITPGDWACACRGLMEPIGVRWKSGKGYQIVHRCRRCRAVRVNRTADDALQPDDYGLILQLMALGEEKSEEAYTLRVQLP